MVAIGSKYIHKKTGNIYVVENYAVDTTNGRGDPMVVVYRPEPNPRGTLYTRDKHEFHAKFTKKEPEDDELYAKNEQMRKLARFL